MALRILLTGAAGDVGAAVLAHLLVTGHEVTATDRGAARPEPRFSALPSRPHSVGDWSYVQADLTSLRDVDALFTGPLDAVIHIAAIPHPRKDLDDHELHHNNVAASYNVLRTAVDRGVNRIVQASSVNAHGLSYSVPDHVVFGVFPIDEGVEMRDEDAYALSKHIAETQAASLVRLVPDVRIASLRLHMVRDSYAKAVPDCSVRDLFSWVSAAAVARACVLSVTSEGWSGHEVFNVVAPTICWEGTADAQSRVEGEDKVRTLDLVHKYCKYTPQIDQEYFEKNPRAALWTSAKAERILGWKHDL